LGGTGQFGRESDGNRLSKKQSVTKGRLSKKRSSKFDQEQEDEEDDEEESEEEEDDFYDTFRDHEDDDGEDLYDSKNQSMEGSLDNFQLDQIWEMIGEGGQGANTNIGNYLA